MDDKEPILLLTHNGWGEELVQSVQLIAGKIDKVYEVALLPNDSLSDYLKRVTEQINNLKWNGKLLILTDINGGTPSNVALRLSRDFEIVAISGLCTSMLLDAVMKQSNGGYTIDIAREIQKNAILNCQILEMPANK